MPTYAWILMWVVVIGLLAFFAVREVRWKRQGPGDFDLKRAGAHGAANRGAAAGPPPQISQNGTGI